MVKYIYIICTDDIDFSLYGILSFSNKEIDLLLRRNNVYKLYTLVHFILFILK